MSFLTHFRESVSINQEDIVDLNGGGFFIDLPPVCPIPNTTTIDLSDPSIAVRYEYNSVHTVLVTIVYPCICLFGILTNSIFLLTVFRVPDMRTITNAYLSNLAVSDIMFLSTGAGFGLWKYLSTPVTADYSICGGAAGCFFTTLLNNTPFHASTFLVTVVTVERYLAVCRPILHRNINSRGHTIGLLAITWLVAACLAVFVFFGGSNYIVKCVMWPDDIRYSNFPQTIASCYNSALWAYVFVAFALTAPTFLAFLVTFTLDVFIVRKLSRRINKFGSEQPSSLAQSRRIRDRVAKMLVITGALFFTLITPRFILSIYFFVTFFAGAPGLSPDAEFIVFVTTNALLYVNSAINPIIYAFSNGRYRHAARLALCSRSVIYAVHT
ncbi:neuromedin-U receptor 2-like [Patiria miniata]|uniref:G-protein coupled receptors family 1 profile domain-containing protein n=1 Tax=Patiria miniata TaxID=46514 RepID=A0A913ZI21_PATMI|nr:neuromedin-U receptor 2-like [Patiria miniata]